ncbi:MAG: hypothetical protein SW833_26190 [Cyanobacteriota bacterium]|nr:hypothetical protein [Cyanobacteriota bacterium]
MMTERSGNITIEEATPQELSELAAELEQYRDRLINETLSTAQRAKIKKDRAMTNIEPSLARIDATLQAIRQRQSTLADGN